MGQTLSEPITLKHSASCENEKFKIGSSSMQGWRVSMEDAHTHILELPDDNEAAFFAVYDGHGGSAVAKYASGNLHKFIAQRSEYKNGDFPTAFTKAFLELDEAMLSDSKLKNDISGTTAVTCLIKGNKLFCGNVGDSRAVACINGQCHPLSFDHKPSNPTEEARIRAAGGWVEYNRVNGNLALSRALGDFSFKRNPNKKPEEQMVSPVPDVEERTITEDWEFIILACDGIWDVITNEEVCELIRYPLGSGMEPDKVCEELLQTCLAPDCQMGGLGCDNMTAILICLLHGQSWDSYCSKIASGLDSTMLGCTRRIREFSFIDSSSDDDEDVIPTEKLGIAKSVAATLCLSLSKMENKLVPNSNESLANDSDQLQRVMQAKDHVYTLDAEKIETPAESPSQNSDTVPSPDSSNKSSADLLGVLNAEVLEESLENESGNQPPADEGQQNRDSSSKKLSFKKQNK